MKAHASETFGCRVPAAAVALGKSPQPVVLAAERGHTQHVRQQLTMQLGRGAASSRPSASGKAQQSQGGGGKGRELVHNS